ncbi:MAG: response regulator [Ardenticatenaceae bacterium]|nr:response regulator [Ardenticatenaceae bacterium]MCB8988394.1 response regulator [Ardenticatenaceae bacterium]
MDPLELDFSQFTILAVDDTPANLTIVGTYLTSLGFGVLTAENGRTALDVAREYLPHLILLDVVMPEMNGLQVCDALKQDPLTADIPVIFMTALSTTEDKVKGFQHGAVDYITKPLSKRELAARITIHLKNQLLTRSYQQHANYLETSSKLGQQVTSILNMNDLLAKATRLIQSRFLYYCVAVWVKSGRQQALILQAIAGRDFEEQQLVNTEIPLDMPRSIVAHVWRHHEIYLTNDVRQDPVYLPNKGLPHTGSEYAIPLLVGKTMIGVLDVQDDKVDAFDEEDRTVLRMMADQLAIAMQNARSYGRLARFNIRLEQEVLRRTAALQNAYGQLAQMDQAKSDFINVASHELFTPISLIKGYTQILLESPKFSSDENQARIVAGIYRGVQRLHEIVESMLDIAKIDNADLELYFQPLSLAALWQQLQQQMSGALADRHIMLDVQPGLQQLELIEGDPEALYKVFSQLLVNAIKYTPDGGQIVVNGRYPTPTTVEITIQDTGIGIDPDKQEFIFSKFYQIGRVDLHSTGKTKFKGGGPGLGLAIARGIIHAHQGEIWVESPGYDEETCPGSTFFIRLPRKQTNS